MNSLLIFATSPNISLASSSDWYLFVSRIGNFSWSSSSTPVSIYLLKTNSIKSFCLSLSSAKMVACEVATRHQSMLYDGLSFHLLLLVLPKLSIDILYQSMVDMLCLIMLQQ